MEATKAMLNWGFLKKSQTGTQTAPSSEGEEGTSTPPTAADDWAYLRTQPDHDAPGARGGVAVAGVTAPVDAQPLDNNWSTGLEIPEELLVCAEVFQDNYIQAPPAPSPAALNATPAFPMRPLTLQVMVANRSMLLTIDGEALIGRKDPDRDTRPEIEISNDDAVSRRHASIFVRNGRYLLRDLDSLNGTRLNRRQLQGGEEVSLNSGDEIEVGDQTMIRVLDLSLEADLTGEDRVLEQMLQEALGKPAAGEEVDSFVLDAWALVSSPKNVDLLDMALEQGSEAGLIATPPAAPSLPGPPVRERAGSTRPRHLA